MTRIKLTEGKLGEDLACDYLKKLGYHILDRNFRLRNGEIDIVAIDKKDNAVVFVEVKTRTTEEFGSPLEAITWWKMKALVRAAQFYKIFHRGLPELMRIDAIAVELRDIGEPIIEHVKNISGY